MEALKLSEQCHGRLGIYKVRLHAFLNSQTYPNRREGQVLQTFDAHYLITTTSSPDHPPRSVENDGNGVENMVIRSIELVNIRLMKSRLRVRTERMWILPTFKFNDHHRFVSAK